MRARFNKLKQLGISLLEVLLSLTIIAIILVMATRYFFLATNDNRVNATREEIASVVSAIHNWKGLNPQYSSSLDISTLWSEGYLADSPALVVTGKTARLYDPWGAEIAVTGGTSSATVTVALPNFNNCERLRKTFLDAELNKSAGSNNPSCDQAGVFTLTVA